MKIASCHLVILKMTHLLYDMAQMIILFFYTLMDQWEYHVIYDMINTLITKAPLN